MPANSTQIQSPHHGAQEGEPDLSSLKARFDHKGHVKAASAGASQVPIYYDLYVTPRWGIVWARNLDVRQTLKALFEHNLVKTLKFQDSAVEVTCYGAIAPRKRENVNGILATLLALEESRAQAPQSPEDDKIRSTVFPLPQ